MNYPVKINAKLYQILESLLNDGVIKQDDKVADFSHVQTITIDNGKVIFEPPVKVSLDTGVINISTTVSEARTVGNGIHVEVDHSPINIKVIPDGLG